MGSMRRQLRPSKQPGRRLAGPHASFDRPLRARRLIKTRIGARHAVVVHDAGIAEIVAPVGFIVMVVVMIAVRLLGAGPVQTLLRACILLAVDQ